MSRKYTFCAFIVFFCISTAFSADGDLLWNVSGVPITHNGTTMDRFNLATDQNGGVYFAWEAGLGYQVCLQRVDYTGQTSGGFPVPGPAWPSTVVLSSGLDNQNPDVISDGSGGAIVAWVEKISDTPARTWVYKAQRVNSAGTKLWASPTILSSPFFGGTQQPKPILVSDGSQGAYIAMQCGYYDCYLVHVNGDGVLTGGVDGLDLGFNELGDAVSDGAGGVIAAGLDGLQVVANRAAVSGAAVISLWGSAVAVGNTTDTPTDIHAVSDGLGGAVIAWNTDDNVRVQRINSAGSALWAAGGLELVSASAVGGVWTYGITSDVCSNGAEGAYVVWSDWRNEPSTGGNCDIYAQHIDRSGSIQWPLYGIRFNNLTAGTQRNPVICADSTGGAVAAWQDYWGLSLNIRACRVNPLGSLMWSNWVINDDLPPSPGAHQKYPKILFANDGPSPVGAVIVWNDERAARANYCQKIQINTLLPPTAPSNLTAAITSPQIHLQWKDNSPNEDGFEIEYKKWSASSPEPTSWTPLDSVGADVMSYQMNQILFFNYYYKFRLRAFNSYGYSDYSNTATVYNGFFLYSITVTQPNGGQSWPAGVQRQITWKSFGTIPFVRIDCSLDGGSHWVDPPIAASTPNDGSFLWTVPNTPSDNCLIRIQDAGDGDPYDLSDQPFRITPPAPDLVIESFACTQQETAIQDQELNFRCIIRNIGSQSAGAFYADFYPNRSSPPGPFEYGTNYAYVPGLEPDETYTWIFTYTYPIPGTQSIYLQLDADLYISEADENNNILGPHALTVYEFERKEETYNAQGWFGGDDRPDWTPRNVGSGQSILLPRSAWAGYAGFQFTKHFDFYTNPTGSGHAVTLVLDVRSGNGTILKTVTQDLPASFTGGWVLFPVEMDLWAQQPYIFTVYLQDGHLNNLKSSIAGRTDNPWPDSQAYVLDNTTPPYDMKNWALWTTHPWDYNFRIAGFYTDLSPSDLVRDYQVNLADFARLAQRWLRMDCTLPDWCGWTDLDYSGGIDVDDLDLWAADWLWEGYGALDRADIAAMDADLSASAISGSDGSQFWPGTYFAYITASGRYGKFIVEKYEPDVNHRLTIGWTTYNADGSIYSTGTGLVIRGTWTCDLDLGVEGGTGEDCQWAIINSTTRSLYPSNGARFKLIYRAPGP
jgi:hypothetical protein